MQQNFMDGIPAEPSSLQPVINGTVPPFVDVQTFMDGTAAKP